MKWAGVAFELTGLILAGLFLGSILDSIWQFSGYAQAGGVILAFLLWIFFVWKRWNDR